MNREKAQISLSNSVLPNTLVCYSCWRKIGKICSENMVLEKICLKIRENAAAFCSEHQNCKENITYVEYEAEINI